MKIGVLYGAWGGEREVALKSLKFVERALQGRDFVKMDVEADRSQIVEFIKSVDVVLPIVHGKPGEDGQIAALCQWLKKLCLFSDSEAHLKAWDKSLARLIVGEAGLRVARIYKEGLDIQKIVKKPKTEGSSLGVQVISADDFDNDSGFLYEEFIEGREFSVGVIDYGGETRVLPVTEVMVGPGVWGYDSKYDGSTTEICPAEIDDDLKNRLQEAAKTAHIALCCKHLSRSDFRVNEKGEVYFLETNTIPGMTETSFVPLMLAAEGIEFADLLDDWLTRL